MKYKIMACLCLFSLLLTPMFSRAALFGEFGLQDEMKLGRQFEVLIKASMPLVEDPEVKNYAQGIVDRIVATLPPQPYKFHTNVLLHNSMNAFATPGGFVFVHTGLIQHLEHESQLAGVLSHEIAHVTQRHIAQRIERSQTISIATVAAAILGALAGGGGDGSGAAMTAATAAGQAAMLNYSRVDESDADQLGMSYLIAAGYNPRGLGGAFSKIQENSWSRGSYPEYLSTHPDVTTRLTALNARIQGLPATIRNRPDDDTQFLRVQTLIWARYGDTQYATQVFSSRDSKDRMTHLGKAILASRQNRIKDAEESFAEALRLAPDDELILREAGAFNYEKGDIQLARQQMEKALRIAPDDYLARFHYARLLDDLGEKVLAQDNYRQVLRFVPEDVEVHTYYGRSLGSSRQDFRGYLHLAYAAVYGNDESKAENWIGRAKSSARTSEDDIDLKRFETIFGERKQVWSQGP